MQDILMSQDAKVTRAHYIKPKVMISQFGDAQAGSNFRSRENACEKGRSGKVS